MRIFVFKGRHFRRKPKHGLSLFLIVIEYSALGTLPDDPFHITAHRCRQGLAPVLQPPDGEGFAALPDDYRAVLVLREIHQRSYQEIADILSLDLGTVKSRINRGRKQLRKFLLESGNFLSLQTSYRAKGV